MPKAASGDQSRSEQSDPQVDPRWAWDAYEPSQQAPWNLQRAAHLYRRAGFGAPWRKLQQALDQGCHASVELLLAGEGNSAAFYEEVQSTVAALSGTSNRQDLPGWWLYVMLNTPHPLLEQMTLLWHNHFATSAAKVTTAGLMFRQNALLRKYALGKFGPLLSEMAKDPAMLIWLDSTTNRKSRPNENFAREVMELFSLGVGNYTEADIKEAARAFTGWEIRQGSFHVNKHQHDTGMKTVLGQRGPWNGEDVVRILLDQPAAGRFLAGKVYRHLVSDDEPPAALLEPLAVELRKREYDMRWLVGTILRSNFFYSDHAIRQKIKPPVDFAVGLVRALEGTTSSYGLVAELENLGQAVFYPPNVKGWNGGTDWITTSTLIARANLVWALVSNRDDRFANKISLAKLKALDGLTSPAQIARRLVDLLIAGPIPDHVTVQLAALAGDSSTDDREQRLARVVHAIATLPEFQLS
jgi:uncharacterized protein (DUF1800 family)